MDWCHRLPQGMRYTGRAGSRIMLGVDLPQTEDGLFLLRCPQVVEHRFGVEINTEEASASSSTVYCPYCGHRAQVEDFYSPETRHRLEEAITSMAEQFMVGELQKMFKDSFRQSKYINFKPGRLPSIRTLPTYTPEPTRRLMNCARCDETYSVFGIALYCVSCGQLAPSAQFTELLKVQHRALGRLDELPEDQRRSWEADGFFAKIYEGTIKDTFGALENFLGQVFRSSVSNADEILSGKGNIFQRLADTSALFDQHLDTKLDGLNPAAWAVLINAAALRHLLTHKDGIVDQKYLQQIPTSQYRIGQRVHVNRVDAEHLLDAATRLGQELLVALQ